jgi:stage III sporulation protein AD
MDVLKIIGIGLTAMVFSVYLRKYSEDFSMYISILAGIMILITGFSYMLPVINVITQYAARTSITNTQISAVLKIISTAYLAQFASDICKDAGSGSLANKIEISARFMIAYFSLPIVLTLFEYISQLV